MINLRSLLLSDQVWWSLPKIIISICPCPKTEKEQLNSKLKNCLGFLNKQNEFNIKNIGKLFQQSKKISALITMSCSQKSKCLLQPACQICWHWHTCKEKTMNTLILKKKPTQSRKYSLNRLDLASNNMSFHFFYLTLS